MEVRQLCTPRHATILKGNGDPLFTIELPSQPLGYDAKKDEGKWYKVDFVFIPDPAAEQPRRLEGNCSIKDLCTVETTAEDLFRKSAKYLQDDPALSVKEPLKNIENSTMTAFYREGHPYVHLKFLNVELEETPWTPGMFLPLKALADAYEAERDAYEKKMHAKVEREGTEDD